MRASSRLLSFSGLAALAGFGASNGGAAEEPAPAGTGTGAGTEQQGGAGGEGQGQGTDAGAGTGTGTGEGQGQGQGQGDQGGAGTGAEQQGGQQTGQSAAASAAAASASTASQPQGDYVLASDALRLADQARVAEATRWNTVMSSEEGKANTANATFLLFHSNAPASSIVAQLKNAPQGAAPASGIGASTPKVDLSGGGAAGAAKGAQSQTDAAAQGNGQSAEDPWKSIHAQSDNNITAGGMNFGQGGAGAGTGAAH